MLTLLATQCSFHLDLRQKNQVHCDQNHDRKSYMSAKIEAEKNIYKQFSANCGTVPTSNQIEESRGWCSWALFGHYFSRLSFLFSFSLSGRRSDIDWNSVSKGRLIQNNQPTSQLYVLKHRL